MAAVTEVSETLAGLTGLLGQLEDFYLDLHRHPELAFQERRTANLVAQQLRRLGYRVSAGIGRTGVVGELANGDGPTVLLRADMDALPLAELTGLPYLSRETVVTEQGREVPVMHACGHDMHVTWLLGAAALLARRPRRWAGRLLVVFQPGEESGEGAQRMVDDGLFDRFGRPDVLFGQHVSPAPAARIGMRAGPLMAAMDALRVRLFGQGASAARPEASVDPVVLAAATVMRLQTVVSREVSPAERVVLTVGQIHAGTAETLIPAEAQLGLSVRTFEEPVRKLSVYKNGSAPTRSWSTTRPRPTGCGRPSPSTSARPRCSSRS